MNKNLTTKQNTDLILTKSKSTLNITSKILSGKTSLTTEIIEDWIKEIWSWADENGVDSSTVPRNKDLLLALETIDLSGLELYSLTSRLCFLEYVTTLLLEENNIEELPKEIVNFKNLKMLNLKNNPFTLTYTQKRWTEQLKEKGCVVHLDSEIVEYSQDKDLVDDSWMKRLWVWADEKNISKDDLPRNKYELLSLTKLYLWNNQLIELAKEIGNLINLTELYLWDNQLAKLPKEIQNLTNLLELDLINNQLTKVPKEIGSLDNLTNLSLENNCLTELPEEIINLQNLNYLQLEGNKLTLTLKQKDWIKTLKQNGCEIYLDDTVETEIHTFYKIERDQTKGITLDDDISAWIDTESKLMWEVKNKTNIMYKYVWEKNITVDTCDKSELSDPTAIDVFSYVQRLNKIKYCGYDDWRIPTIQELEMLINRKLRPILGMYTHRCIKVPLIANSYRSTYCSITEEGEQGELFLTHTIYSYTDEELDKQGYHSIRCVRHHNQYTDLHIQNEKDYWRNII